MNQVKTEDAPSYNTSSDLIDEKEDEKIIQSAINILHERLKHNHEEKEMFNSSDDVKLFLMMKNSELEHEEFSVLFLDQKHRLIEYKVLFQGTINATGVYPREIVKHALKVNSAAIILSHNHPSGDSDPSDADLAMTKKIKEACELLDISMLDHIVIGKNECYSIIGGSKI